MKKIKMLFAGDTYLCIYELKDNKIKYKLSSNMKKFITEDYQLHDDMISTKSFSLPVSMLEDFL